MSSVAERLPSAEFISTRKLTYVDTRALHRLFEKLAFRANLILVGPKGIGKSLAVAAYCATKSIPVITVDCSEDVRRSQLLGMFTIRGSETPFVLGPVTTALEVANDCGKAVLLFEEVNCLAPQVQKVLNPITDWRCSIEVPEAQQVFRLKPDAQLWVVGTMNSSTYQGVHSLNEDLKSRFRMLPLEYPKPAEESKILETLLKERGQAVDPGLLSKVLTLAKESRQDVVDYPLSTRDLLQILEDAQAVGIHQALWIISGKYDGADRVAMLKRMEGIFGVAEKLIDR